MLALKKSVNFNLSNFVLQKVYFLTGFCKSSEYRKIIIRAFANKLGPQDILKITQITSKQWKSYFATTTKKPKCF